MINRKTLRTFLRKTKGEFINTDTVSRLLTIKDKSAAEILTYLEELGYIEKLSSNGLWVHAVRGKILAFRSQKRTYKPETLKEHLHKLIEKVQYINSSTDYPEEVVCLKIISSYPGNDYEKGMNIAYCIRRKDISYEHYKVAADRLRKKYNAHYNNLTQWLSYPETALRNYLKTSSPALQLRSYSFEKIKLLEGRVLFEIE